MNMTSRAYRRCSTAGHRSECHAWPATFSVSHLAAAAPLMNSSGLVRRCKHYACSPATCRLRVRIHVEDVGWADQAPRIPTHSLRTGRVLALGFQVITSRQDSSPRSFKREKSAGTHFCFGVTFMHRSTACHNDDLGINLIDVDRRGESHLRSAHGCTIESAIVSQATLHQPRQPTNPKVRTPTG